MADRSWMLKPQAIRIAKECIEIVKSEQGIRLKLSQPDLMQQLHQLVDESDSRELGDAYARLLAMAGVGAVMQNLNPPTDINDIAWSRRRVGEV